MRNTVIANSDHTPPGCWHLRTLPAAITALSREISGVPSRILKHTTGFVCRWGDRFFFSSETEQGNEALVPNSIHLPSVIITLCCIYYKSVSNSYFSIRNTEEIRHLPPKPQPSNCKSVRTDGITTEMPRRPSR